ncbi:hypothetical protein YPPY13_4048, partial [Yersinia pestis PY-13]
MVATPNPANNARRLSSIVLTV